MTIRTLINLTDTSFVLTDFFGKLVEPYESFTANNTGDYALQHSNDVAARLLDGSLKLNNGANDYYGIEAISIILDGDLPKQFTPDGKLIVATANIDRPPGTSAQLLGCGDNLVTGEIGAGPEYIISMTPSEGTSAHFDIRYTSDIWLRGGTLKYTGAQIGTYVNLYVIAPAQCPYPAYNGDGVLDWIDEQWVPNTTNTGKYKINMTQDVCFDRYFTKKMLLGDGLDELILTEPHKVWFPYYMRLELVLPTGPNIDVNQRCSLALTMMIFRSLTISDILIME